VATSLDVLEGILKASAQYKQNKLTSLNETSVHLNMLRIFIRLARDIKLIDSNKYVRIQQQIDEIGRMLGGWIKHCKE